MNGILLRRFAVFGPRCFWVDVINLSLFDNEDEVEMVAELSLLPLNKVESRSLLPFS